MKLSVIVLNYNTKDLTLKCINSIVKNTKNLSYEIIVVDNGSEENFQLSNSNFQKKVKLLRNDKNLGFAGGNNSAREFAKGEYILFLNSDTEVYKETLEKTVDYLSGNKDVGALTCKTVLPSGELDKDVRRSFPTPFVAFTHFSGLDRLFPKSRIFARYWYGYESADEIQEIEVLQGAFFLTKKKILDEVGWFSEDYFLDGEDIDLCWKIHELGYKIIYYPETLVLHIKKASKRKQRNYQLVMSGVDAMEIFYKKRLWGNYPLFVNFVVLFAIYFLKTTRFVKAVLHL